jgi:replicative DNA helicase
VEGMSYEAEKAVIGSLLIDNESIEGIYSTLEPNMFTDALLGKIYFEVRQSYDKGKKIDAITLFND